MSKKSHKKNKEQKHAQPDENQQDVQGTEAEAADDLVDSAADTPQLETASELNDKLAEYEDLIKRQQAEFDNFRKRTIREKEDFRKYAGSEIFIDFLSVKDNFERALSVEVKDKAIKNYKKGFEMILDQFNDIFSKHNVMETPGVGEEFDPNVHQSITMEEADDVDCDTVAEVFQKGYCLYDRVLRIAQVKVKQAKKTDEENK